ncbi:NTP transferase domain-containing protein [Cohnella sp. GbtcB17]|uniref:nucleotidyltransferase family protein n=1 Tax=Cohnella sp. GbtcB17 TaxID=2824762 RepID=UPI001C2F32B6|nr:nucleotidyltransferase family protein [Cohnella sp. GbtcB17]
MIAAIYLAAGAGRRMNGPKLTAELMPGVPLGALALRTLLTAGLNAVYAIVRPGAELEWLYGLSNDALRKAAPEPKRSLGTAEDDRPTAEESAPAPGGTLLETIVCSDAERGMAHSLRCGIGRAAAAGQEAAIVMLADQPFVTPAMVQDLIDCWRTNPALDYVAGSAGDVMTPPVLLARSTFSRVIELEGDMGAKRLLQSAGFIGAERPFDEPWRLLDVDTPEGLERAKRIAAQIYVT